mmetsp:Transcript_124633/g.399163  ORF Transcript_124633/g.399163 Transcript_124633/m.399163 type:complete len:227 (-) Transcript_124633:461-1141(-)
MPRSLHRSRMLRMPRVRMLRIRQTRTSRCENDQLQLRRVARNARWKRPRWKRQRKKKKKSLLRQRGRTRRPCRESDQPLLDSVGQEAARSVPITASRIGTQDLRSGFCPRTSRGLVLVELMRHGCPGWCWSFAVPLHLCWQTVPPAECSRAVASLAIRFESSMCSSKTSGKFRKRILRPSPISPCSRRLQLMQRHHRLMRCRQRLKSLVLLPPRRQPFFAEQTSGT